METFHGYMLEATISGDQLTLHGTTKASRMALNGQDHATDPVVPLDTIAGTDWREAGRMVNGRLVIRTLAGQTYQLHFRRKQQDDMERLLEALPSRGQ